MHALVPRHDTSGMIYKLDFPRDMWNILTFSNDSKTTNKCALDIMNEILKYSINPEESSIVLYLTDVEMSSSDNTTIKNIERCGIQVLPISCGLEKGQESTGLQYNQISVLNSPPAAPVNLANIVVLNGIIGDLTSSGFPKDVIIKRLKCIPMRQPGFSIVHKDGPCRVYAREHPKAFMGCLDPTVRISLETLCSNLTMSRGINGESPLCPYHADVKINQVQFQRDYALMMCSGTLKSTSLSLSSPPTTDCVYCLELKLAIVEQCTGVQLPNHIACTQPVLLSIFRMLANIGYVESGASIEPKAIRSTDHAMVINAICDKIHTHPILSSVGVSTGTYEINKRNQHALILNAGEEVSQQFGVLCEMFLENFGELNQWGYYSCDVTSNDD